jgi:hypothetical protein
VASRRTHHSPRRHLRGFGYFSRLGPAVVTGAADDDPSGIGTYSQVGASFGFGLLWLAPFTLPLAAAVQETAGRLYHGLVCDLDRPPVPRPVFWFAVGSCASPTCSYRRRLAAMARPSAAGAHPVRRDHRGGGDRTVGLRGGHLLPLLRRCCAGSPCRSDLRRRALRGPRRLAGGAASDVPALDLAGSPRASAIIAIRTTVSPTCSSGRRARRSRRRSFGG